MTLLETIGRGRYGIVQRGVLESSWGLRRPLVVKTYQLAPDFDPGDAMRCLGEISRRLVCVRHPSVIQLYDLDRTDRLHNTPYVPYALYELVEGEPLSSLVAGWQRGGVRVPMDFALVVALRAAEALGAALFSEGPDGSLTGLLHGDLSPRQIIISNQGDVKVGDFGQFTLGEGQSSVRTTPSLEYTAPEIVWGNAPDARSDVFSLGAILRELLLGPRFQGTLGPRESMRMVRDGLFQASLLEPNIPRSLRDVLEQALAPNPSERYGHARAFAFDLRREMLRLNLTDAQTCVRHAIVGWCDAPSDSDMVELDASELEEMPASRRRSEIVPKGTGLSDQETDLPEFLFGSSPPSVK
jgi:serine/threonine protein kinase